MNVMFKRALLLLPFLSFVSFAQDAPATARKALDLMLTEKYSDMAPLFTAEAKKDLSPEALAKIGTQVKAMGAVEQVRDAQVTKSGTNTIVVLPVKFATQILNFRMIVNGSGLISAFFLTPGGIDWSRPSYS